MPCVYYNVEKQALMHTDRLWKRMETFGGQVGYINIFKTKFHFYEFLHQICLVTYLCQNWETWMPGSRELMIQAHKRIVCSHWKGGRFLCNNSEREPRQTERKGSTEQHNVESHLAAERGGKILCLSKNTCVLFLENFWLKSHKNIFNSSSSGE